uniref:Beta-glucosidase cel3A n=1 Tax=Bionectria ochroleuca TaxID=29856 RepID=A0A0B7KQP3_BIOOC
MLFSSLLVVASALTTLADSDGTRKEYFDNLERFWSYGRSPPVYPSPEASGRGDWQEAWSYATVLVSQMTLEENVNLTYGYSTEANGCNGKIAPIPRLGFKGLCMNNAGNGVGGNEGSNVYPAALHVGTSWNRQLAYDRALYMGREFKQKGVNVALGPSTGPLGRLPKGGRNWEAPSNDPYLSRILTYETTVGLQRSVMACVKHLIGNEQETSRKAPRKFENDETHPSHYNASISSNIDDKTMHELYLWPFYDSIRAGAGSVMCAYQRVNSYSCQNSKVLNGLLKTEMAFEGFVVSDWYEHKSGVGSANAGLDVVMPVAPLWQEGLLVEWLGMVPEARVDDMVKRVVAAAWRFADFDAGTGISFNLTQAHSFVDAREPYSKHILLQGAVEGHVLVKNVKNALPLQKPRFISVFGYDAVVSMRHIAEGPGFNTWKMGLAGSQRFMNGSVLTNEMLDYLFASSADQTVTGPEIALNGTLTTGGGSDASIGSNIDAPLDAIRRQAYEDDTAMAWDVQSPAPLVNKASEACFVFINAQASESWDRKNLTDSYSDNIVTTVANQCNNTMVIIHTAGVRLVDAWYDHPNVTAIIIGHLPGQDSGRALVEILYGKQSPSGRMPYTVAKKESDYGVTLDPDFPSEDTPYYPQSNFTEGIYIDYKHFEKHSIEPRFPFGFGLKYSEFEYSNLRVHVNQNKTDSRLPPNPGTVLPGGIVSLWDKVAEIRVDVANTGAVAAAEVAQLYLGIPGGAKKVLRGFEKQLLNPGSQSLFSFLLTRRDLSTWDVAEQQWVLQSGTYQVYVGKSVTDIQLTGEFTV